MSWKRAEERMSKLEDIAEVITEKATKRNKEAESSKGNEKKIWKEKRSSFHL